MEEMYILHDLQGPESEHLEESFCEPVHEPHQEPVHRPIMERTVRDLELAQAYVMPQPLEGVFPPEEGLRMGTAFPNLSQPYCGRD